MMYALQDYLENGFLAEKELYHSIEDLIIKAMPFYQTIDSTWGWPYDIKTPPTHFSASTTSMIAYSLSVVLGGGLDICLEEKSDAFTRKEKMTSKYKKILNESVVTIKDNIEKLHQFTSDTYGNNDPFTLTWVSALSKNGHIDSQLFKDLVIKRVKSVFKQIYTDKEKIKYSDETDNGGRIESSHIFPLLKIVQLYRMFQEDIAIDKEYVRAACETLLYNIHYHLSLESIENSNFDGAELVFALEGYLLLNGDNIDKSFINRVFSVMKKRQDFSIYWRPLKPFVLTQRGLALLPLSIEIAMSLLRICRIVGDHGNTLFSENFEIFQKYTEWVKTRIIKISPKEISKGRSIKEPIYGWCSEHIYQPSNIHPWETSQVILYLLNFNDLLQKHIANKLLKLSYLYVRPFEKNILEWENWLATEPVQSLQNYRVINSEYICSNKNHSMLFYGPPGTGKTTLAKKIALAKGWPLITITPSDFISNGIDQVETKTKNIFAVLNEQKNKVVFFDEIDRLILDRDSDEYSKQNDIFQFMTPSMLVKLQELRDRENVIFIISTNYEDNIDKAIKRIGRIDERFLILPPELNRRKEIILDLIKEMEFKLSEQVQEKIAQLTPLYSYGELEKLMGNIKISNHNEIEYIERLIVAPSISILSYKKRFEKERPQYPLKELFYLVFLKIQTGASFSNNEKSFLTDIWRIYKDDIREEFEDSTLEYIKNYIDSLSNPPT